jgi:hypothetical protein
MELTGTIVTDREDPEAKYLEIRKGLLYYSLSSNNLIITSPNPPIDDNTEYLSFGKGQEYEIIASVKIEKRQPPIEIQIGCASNTERNSQEEEGWQTVAAGIDCRQALERLIEDMNNENISIDNNWLRIKQADKIINL